MWSVAVRDRYKIVLETSLSIGLASYPAEAQKIALFDGYGQETPYAKVM